MDAKQLMIPDKIKVGFQNRGDTYTKKLAYVIYFDQKGVLRKEKSWQSWRDHKIAPIEHDNVPTEGFVLNKGVGGVRQSYGWNARNEYVRVFDPRNFEFEISVANLLFILRECDCSKGKGLEGKFVYAWDGTELVLLPECSVDYQNSKNYTKLQTCNVEAKNLIAGATYQTKKQENYIYLGRFTKYVHAGSTWKREKTSVMHVFWAGTDFVFLKDMKSLAVLHSDAIVTNYAELVDKYNKSIWGSKAVKLFTKKSRKKNRKKKDSYWTHQDSYWTHQDQNGDFFSCSSSFQQKYNNITNKYEYSENPTYITAISKMAIKDGTLCSEPINKTRYRDPKVHEKERAHHNLYYRNYPCLDHWIEPTGLDLWVEFESGSQFKYSGSNLIDHTKKEEVYDDDEDY